ncbi:cellulose binding domain-containing protein [Sphaerisporangium sp. B11E5]|uniref:cellulose binding domain-containing protein n=1 Tax=Sphaerisporangium sp. B11E5 TaxID=3153563 RepID=UPI00325E5909
MRFPRLRRVLMGGALLAAGTLVHAATPAVAAADPVQVTVNTRAGLAAVPDTGIGVNHAIWDTTLGSDPVADLLKDAGVQMVRYPGGSYADIYHWKTHTAPGGYVAPDTDFDTFMRGARRTGAQPIIIANYGTGTPQEAAEWVEYANVTKGYGVKYWEIGNENYGNGHYGSQWEADDHADKSPDEYARNVVAYSQAMKAKDPTIKIGAVLTTPANWPDAITAAGDPGSWNQRVLSIAGPSIDFVILHWYPGQTGVADMLTKTAHIDDMMYLLKRQIAQYAGAGSSRIGIAVTELSSTVGTNTQPGALFAAEAYTRLLEHGVFTVDWWNVHNGMGTVSQIAGHTDYGDWGLLSSAQCSGDVCQPPFNTPFAPYHALDMMSVFARPGDQLVRAAATDPLVSAHAVRRADGEVAVLLVNKDPDASREVALDYAGFAPAAGAPVVHSFTNGAAGVTSAPAGTATAQTLPPYSLTTVVLRPASAPAGLPGAPGRPEASAVTDTTATISWPAATAGSRPIAKYEVHRQFGAVSEQWGETSGTSFTVRNLRPGTRYTVNVITRDTGGGTSWSSEPVTFTTGSPAQSSCSVRFTDNNDWGNGYIVGLDVTNTGTEPLSDWTLAFSWPTDWQQINGGWSATWAQEGRTVTVKAPAGAGPLAPGATVSAGTVASYSGPNVLPALFTLNGRTCTTL